MTGFAIGGKILDDTGSTTICTLLLVSKISYTVDLPLLRETGGCLSIRSYTPA